jgi:hypothetical protein
MPEILQDFHSCVAKKKAHRGGGQMNLTAKMVEFS